MNGYSVVVGIDGSKPCPACGMAVPWLRLVEMLKPGDQCEVRYGGSWIPARVVKNGGPHFWELEVRVPGVKRVSLHIEGVRCVGQTEAWPR